MTTASHDSHDKHRLAHEYPTRPIFRLRRPTGQQKEFPGLYDPQLSILNAFHVYTLNGSRCHFGFTWYTRKMQAQKGFHDQSFNHLFFRRFPL